MRAVVFEDDVARVVQRPPPRAAPDEAVVRVTLAGICGTDLEIARGYLAFAGIPGHEFVGVVEAAGCGEWIGRRVVGEINVVCGRCGPCRAGLPRHCSRRSVLGIQGRDGAFAERLALPVANLHAVPAGLPDEAAVFAEPLAAAHEVLEQLDPPPGSAALVLGDGRLGQLCAAALARAGIRPVVCGRHPHKLARLQRMGLRTVVGAAGLRREYDLVVEATGSPEGLRDALRLARPRGTIALKSTYHGAARVDLAGLVIDEQRIVGSRCGPLAPALEHLAQDPSVVDGLVSAVYALDEAPRAFEHAARGDALKVLLRA